MVILDLTRILNKKINFNIRLIDTKESIIKRLVYGLRKIYPLLPKYIDIVDFDFDSSELEVVDLFSTMIVISFFVLFLIVKPEFSNLLASFSE